MVGWHHPVNGDEFEQTLGDSEGQGSLACCSPWSRRESDTTWQLSNNKNEITEGRFSSVHTGNSARRRNVSLGGRIKTRKYNGESEEKT